MTKRGTVCCLLAAAGLLLSEITAPRSALLAQTTTTLQNNSVTIQTHRFRDPDGITGDPTGLRRDTTVHMRPGPRYPIRRDGRGPIGFPVVAFVIDTTGRVEQQTVTFINSSPSELRSAVCDYVRMLRFEPFDVGGAKTRVLLVRMYGFDNLFSVDTTSLHAADALAAKTQEEFATHPISQAVGKLETMPHCD
ncbi:MAG: energy transducer TonB [Gemmatimonadaceae bacterium]